MKVQTAILAMLLVAAAVSAQEVGEVVDQDSPSGFGAFRTRRGPRLIHTNNIIHASGDFSADLVPIGGRKMSVDRHLQGYDGNTTLGVDVTINNASNTYSQVGKYCPADNQPWGGGDNYANVPTMYSRYGDFIHDAGICDVTGRDGVGKVATSQNSAGVVYGGAAQDFGSGKSNWESYGWSLFKLKGMPAEKEDIKIQGVQLHVLGNVGSKHQAGTVCSIKAVSVAIYNAQQTGDFNPTALNYTKKVDLSGANATQFTWTSNSSQVLYLDIANAPEAFPRFDNNTYYWLRIKLFADYGGSTGAGQCFAFWGMSSKITSNDQNVRSRWQEKIGGASGYSTTCVGAGLSGSSNIVVGGSSTQQTVPGKFQTFWNCWNNGVNIDNSNTGRRCSTYRSTVNPAIPVQDCLDVNFRARFNDFNYAFSGAQGEPGAAGGGGLAGTGGGGPTDTIPSP